MDQGVKAGMKNEGAWRNRAASIKRNAEYKGPVSMDTSSSSGATQDSSAMSELVGMMSHMSVQLENINNRVNKIEQETRSTSSFEKVETPEGQPVPK